MSYDIAREQAQIAFANGVITAAARDRILKGYHPR